MHTTNTHRGIMANPSRVPDSVPRSAPVVMRHCEPADLLGGLERAKYAIRPSKFRRAVSCSAIRIARRRACSSACEKARAWCTTPCCGFPRIRRPVRSHEPLRSASTAAIDCDRQGLHARRLPSWRARPVGVPRLVTGVMRLRDRAPSRDACSPVSRSPSPATDFDRRTRTSRRECASPHDPRCREAGCM